MKKAKKKKKIVWQQYIGMLFMLLIGAFCGYIGLYVGERAAGPSSKQGILVYIVLILSIYPALFFHIIVHEAGHLIFGLLTGYKFSSFRIASFMWLKENGKLKLKRLSLAGTGGQCLMIPPSMKNGKIPVVLYNLGGSLVNVFFSVLFLLLYILCKDIPFLSSILVVFSIMGFGIAIMNGIPMRVGSVDNDGYNAFALLKNKSAIEAFWVQLKVGEQLSKGVRIKEMPQEWFEIPSDEEMKNSMVASRCVFACNRLMDMEKFEEADKLMEHLLEIDSGIIGLHINLLVCDRIFVELIRENRRDFI
ncbi:MAG: M50 family metallopeptidase [Clostridia bacterium]|nr:M50 family metallopeptidase [Clostridia bacterium]